MKLDIVPLARTQRHRRSEVPACARAPDRNATRVEAECRRALEQPACRSEAVVDRDRESMLWGQGDSGRSRPRTASRRRSAGRPARRPPWCRAPSRRRPARRTPATSRSTAAGRAGSEPAPGGRACRAHTSPAASRAPRPVRPALRQRSSRGEGVFRRRCALAVPPRPAGASCRVGARLRGTPLRAARRRRAATLARSSRAGRALPVTIEAPGESRSHAPAIEPPTTKQVASNARSQGANTSPRAVATW